ncbi:hypothetical protein Tco_1477997, partial [Tanacetum coccineum]
QDSSAKRAGDKLEFDESKKQKTDENEEVEVDNEAELKMHMVIVKDDDIAIDAIPLATKPPVIVEYKLIKEGIMGHYQLIRADGSSKRYSSMIRMLQGIDREDLQTLWKLVKTKHGDTRPEDDHERVLWGDLKVMFKPDIESDVWRNLQEYKVTVWKLFDSCGVHFVRGGLLGLKDFKMILRVTTAQEVIMNGDAPAIASANTEGPISPKTVEQKLARKNELKAKSTLLLAILDKHLLKFHGIKDAKTL